MIHRKAYLIKGDLALYLHFGSEPNVLDILNQNFKTEESAEELFKMGDIIKLGENLENTIFFSRDQKIEIEKCVAVNKESIYTGDSNKFVFRNDNEIWEQE